MLIQEITDYFCNLVRIDSPSGSEEKVREFLCRELKEIAGEGQIDPAGNLKFTLPGTLPGPVCLFSSHMDTVEPGRKISPQMGEDGRIHSDGTTVLGADDKDGITALVFALKRLHREKAPHVPLEFLFTAGEEKSLSGSSKLSADFLKAEYAWVLDGPGTPGTIYRNGVGKIGFTITVTGKAAHAGICPEKGVNAFMLMAEAMQEFPPGRWENATVNYGTVSGGQANNIVPEKVFLTGEIRSHSPERLEELVQKMKQVWSGVRLRWTAMKKNMSGTRFIPSERVASAGKGERKRASAACSAIQGRKIRKLVESRAPRPTRLALAIISQLRATQDSSRKYGR